MGLMDRLLIATSKMVTDTVMGLMDRLLITTSKMVAC
jgi:hypothetical protein